ncbi:MAG: tRNA pseudouridine(13) synthase TruD [Halobacteriaceae archaeon]
MRAAHPAETTVGIEYYVSDADGIGGRLRDRPGDFRVEELEGITPEPVDADAAAYPHLVVRATLENWDTNDFARALANRLGISRERINWAGTKDKRAVTTQLVSIKGIDPEALPTLSGVELSVVGRFGRGLAFGDLAGNEFTVTVRDPTAPDRVPAVSEDLHSFAGDRGPGTTGPVVGVPNYFGHQRFGSGRPITHEVGLAIVERAWERAVRIYLTEPGAGEPDATSEVRTDLAGTEDWARALDRFPTRLRFERAMLHVLADGGSYRDALAALPENLRRLFVHAAQSYVFNRVVSRRLEAGLPFGSPVPGDVVCFTEDRGGLQVPDPSRTQRVTDDRVEVIDRHCRRGRAVVTAPLVGTDTEFGEGRPGEIERSVLESVGLTRDQFDLPAPYDSTGTRRAILVWTDLVASVDDEVVLSFGLPKGAYATVVLREYLKTPPSTL